jgi:hypothetical protein
VVEPSPTFRQLGVSSDGLRQVIYGTYSRYLVLDERAMFRIKEENFGPSGSGKLLPFSPLSDETNKWRKEKRTLERTLRAGSNEPGTAPHAAPLSSSALVADASPEAGGLSVRTKDLRGRKGGGGGAGTSGKKAGGAEQLSKHKASRSSKQSGSSMGLGADWELPPLKSSTSPPAKATLNGSPPASDVSPSAAGTFSTSSGSPATFNFSSPLQSTPYTADNCTASDGL